MNQQDARAGMMSETVIEVIIEKFHPLTIVWPDGELVGKVRIVLPPIHLRICDLGMGGVIPGDPHLGSDTPIAGINIFTPTPLDKGDFMNFIEESRGDMEQLWTAYQTEFDKREALVKW